jgi:tetratricopeptide (TPR) repeat protein
MHHRTQRPAIQSTTRPAALALAGVVLAAGLAGCQQNRAARPTRAEPLVTEQPQERVKLADTWVDSAQQAVREGDSERALAEFERAIEINPNLTSAYMGMGDIYRMNDDYIRAEARYRRAAQIEPRNFTAQYFHGLMLHLLDRVTDAVQAYLRALAINPDDFQTNLNIATAYYQLDENVQALRYGQRAVELDPQNGPARLNLGVIYAALGQHQSAVNEYQQATEFMPLTPTLLLNLAESLGKLERWDEMTATLTGLIESEPKPPAKNLATAFERLGFAKFRQRDFESAKQNFEAAIQVEDTYFPALNGLGVCLLNDFINGGRRDLDIKDRGVSMLRRSLQLNPDQPQVVEILSKYSR